MLEKGLLWFDDDPRKQLEEIVRSAARRYKAKHGCSPNLCYVHLSALGGNGNGEKYKAGEVEIRAGRSVLLHHFWIGVVEKPKPRQIEMNLPDVREHPRPETSSSSVETLGSKAQSNEVER